MAEEVGKSNLNPEPGTGGPGTPEGTPPPDEGLTFETDPRFQGNTEELWKSYRELEVEKGRLGDELGKRRLSEDTSIGIIEKLLKVQGTPSQPPTMTQEEREALTEKYRENPLLLVEDLKSEIQTMITQVSTNSQTAVNRMAIDSQLRGELGARYDQFKPEIDEFLEKNSILFTKDPREVAAHVARWARGGKATLPGNGVDRAPAHTEGRTTVSQRTTGRSDFSSEEEEWLSDRGWTKEQLIEGRKRMGTNPLKRGFKGE